MTTPSAPAENPEDIDLHGQKTHTNANTEGHYAHRLSPLEEGYSPQTPEAQPHNRSSQTTVSIIRRTKERRMRWVNLGLRSAALLFSFLSFVIMAATNENGLKFDDYEEYRYSLAISVLAFVYLACQLCKAIYEVVVGYGFQEPVVAYVDFVGDQVTAYLTVSAASSAASLTNRLRDGGDSSFTDMAAGSVSMSFLSFAVVAASCLLSGFQLSRHIGG